MRSAGKVIEGGQISRAERIEFGADFGRRIAIDMQCIDLRERHEFCGVRRERLFNMRQQANGRRRKASWRMTSQMSAAESPAQGCIYALYLLLRRAR